MIFFFLFDEYDAEDQNNPNSSFGTLASDKIEEYQFIFQDRKSRPEAGLVVCMLPRHLLAFCKIAFNKFVVFLIPKVKKKFSLIPFSCAWLDSSWVWDFVDGERVEENPNLSVRSENTIRSHILQPRSCNHSSFNFVFSVCAFSWITNASYRINEINPVIAKTVPVKIELAYKKLLIVTFE